MERYGCGSHVAAYINPDAAANDHTTTYDTASDDATAHYYSSANDHTAPDYHTSANDASANDASADNAASDNATTHDTTAHNGTPNHTTTDDATAYDATPAMRLSVMINTFNEGPRVAATCKAFLDAGADEVVVCADGSTDGSCDHLPDKVKVVRNEISVGCGQAKIKATDAATGDVFCWVDAHQNVVNGDLRAMAKAAMDEDAVLCPALLNIYYTETWEPRVLSDNPRIFWPNDIAIAPHRTEQYTFTMPDKLHMVGVGLTMSRATYKRVGAWNHYLARHGSQERGMALRAFMAGVPVRCAQDMVFGHEFYGSSHPSRNATGHFRFQNIVSGHVNLWHAFQTVVSPQTFEQHFKPLLLAVNGGSKGAMAEKYDGALRDHAYFHRHCKKRSDQELIEFLEALRRTEPISPDTGTAMMEPAALRILEAEARGRCLEFGTGSGNGTRALLKGARAVVSVDHIEKYTLQAQENIEDVEFLHCPINAETGFYEVSGITGLFDTIVIDGPPGTQARMRSAQIAYHFLAPGGAMYVDDAKRDKLNIERACNEYPLKAEILPTQRGLAKLTHR